MDIIFHSHHAAISESMRQRARSGLRRLTSRSGRAVDAIVRFEQDGVTRRVEIVLHAPRHTRLIAEANGRFYGPLLAEAMAKLQRQLASARKASRAKAKRAAVVRRTARA